MSEKSDGSDMSLVMLVPLKKTRRVPCSGECRIFRRETAEMSDGPDMSFFMLAPLQNKRIAPYGRMRSFGWEMFEMS